MSEPVRQMRQASIEDDAEPSALGAAPTLPGGRNRRNERKIRRDERRESEARRQRDSEQGVDSDIVHIFEARSHAKTSLLAYGRRLWARRRFMVALAKSDLRGARSSTVLGSIWGLLDPIFQSAIYFFLFVVIRGGEGRPVEFLPLLVGGIFLFRMTMTALNEGGKSVRRSSGLLLGSNFPRALLPLSVIYKGLLNFIPTAVVFAGLYALLGEPPQPGLLWLPALFAILVVLSIGLALAMSTLVVFFKDAQNATQYVQRILFFTTPVIYPIAVLPDNIREVLSFQPLFPLFANFQYVLGGGGVDTTLLLQSVAWAIAFLLIGAWLFLHFEQDMASRL